MFDRALIYIACRDPSSDWSSLEECVQERVGPHILYVVIEYVVLQVCKLRWGYCKSLTDGMTIRVIMRNKQWVS